MLRVAISFSAVVMIITMTGDNVKADTMSTDPRIEATSMKKFYEDSCFYDDGVTLFAQPSESETWLDNCRRNIEASLSLQYSKPIVSVPVSCICLANVGGNISDISIWETSNLPATDQFVVDVLRKVATLTGAPKNHQIKKWILVKFLSNSKFEILEARGNFTWLKYKKSLSDRNQK